VRCLVLAGLIGAGKTTLARALSGTHDVLTFDIEWHERMQRSGFTPDEAARRLAGLVNARGRDVVIDGWWTWHEKWYEDETDGSLQTFASRLRRHAPEVVFLAMTEETAWAAYLEKYQRGVYRQEINGERVYSLLDDPKSYRESLQKRRECIARRVAEWAR